MAFVSANLVKLIGGTGGETLWHYPSAGDSLATVIGANYFDSTLVDKKLKDGDVILVNPTAEPAGIIRITVEGSGDLSSATILSTLDT